MSELKLGGEKKRTKLWIVDLAGSEKIAKTEAEGLRLEEAKTINGSLTTLGLVISKLSSGKGEHIPYRDSKVTRILQESLGGNAKTVLCICCSPSIYNVEETLSTLGFGSRAKLISNKAKINKEMTVAEYKKLVEQLQEEIRLLKSQKGDSNDDLIKEITELKQ